MAKVCPQRPTAQNDTGTSEQPTRKQTTLYNTNLWRVWSGRVIYVQTKKYGQIIQVEELIVIVVLVLVSVKAGP
jgi:hypothetical protein